MSLADSIERYILREMELKGGELEIQRNGLSGVFGCAPSQINYVLETRFTHVRGFMVESRRGGAGYIRVIRLSCPPRILDLLERHVGTSIDQTRAGHLVHRLREAGVLSGREAAIMLGAVDRQVLGLGLPERDRLRARLLNNMILSLFRPEDEQGEADSGAM